MKMNLEKWNEARKEVEQLIKAQKTKLRGELAQSASHMDWIELYDLKSQATRLYVIRAGSRGKAHVVGGEVQPDLWEFELEIKQVG